jgi:uncharacterized RDD family membrane protein YckC
MAEREPSVLRDGAGRADTRAATTPVEEKPAPRPPARRGPAVPTFHVAGFWRRAAAAGIDLAVLLPVCLLLGLLAGALSGIRLPPSRFRGPDIWLDTFLAGDPALLGFLGLSLAIGSVYALVFQLTMGRTLGMRVLKIRIIDLYGEEPSTVRAIVRTCGYLAGVFTLGLGFFWIGFDREKRGLHDWLSGTYVVKA